MIHYLIRLLYYVIGSTYTPFSLFVASATELLFAEELGLILEVAVENERAVIDEYAKEGVSCQAIGRSNSGDVSRQASIFSFDSLVLFSLGLLNSCNSRPKNI